MNEKDASLHARMAAITSIKTEAELDAAILLMHEVLDYIADNEWHILIEQFKTFTDLIGDYEDKHHSLD